jgi:hypothetical protein
MRLGDTVASVRELANGESIARRSRRSQRGIGHWSTNLIGWTLVASVRELATETAHAEAAEEKYSLLISMDLIGLRYLYADSHFRQVHIANG